MARLHAKCSSKVDNPVVECIADYRGTAFEKVFHI